MQLPRIILAEDDPSISDSVKLILERAGYMLEVLPNGDGLINDDHELPELYILDKQLSGIDGLDICLYIKKT